MNKGGKVMAQQRAKVIGQFSAIVDHSSDAGEMISRLQDGKGQP